MTKLSVKDMLCNFATRVVLIFAFIADKADCDGLHEIRHGRGGNPGSRAARIKNTVAMVDEKKGLGSIEEMVFNVTGKKKLICRNFSINKTS